MKNQQRRGLGGRSVFAIVSAFIVSIGVAHAADSPWVRRFDGGFRDVANALATDGLGNAYVAGDVESADRKSEFAVLKYDPSGALLWSAKYLNAQHATSGGSALAIAVDAAGNVYAAGYVYTQVSLFILNLDWLVVSYTPNGVERWSHRINGTANVRDSAHGVAIDATGNVFVSGSIDDAENAGVAGWTLIKYSSNGAPLWRRTDVRSDGTRDHVGRLLVDRAGNVIGGGVHTTTAFGNPNDILTIKLDPQGNVLWRNVFTETTQSDEISTDMDLDANGNVYITGETVASTNPELEHIPVTLKYNSSGALQFLLRGNGAGGESVAVDPSGDIVVSGTSFLQSGVVGLTATAKYDASGHLIWLTPNVTGNVSLDAAGNIYLLNKVLGSGNGNRFDAMTTKLSGNGSLLWQHRYDGRLTNNGSADWAVTSALDSFDNLFAVVNANDGTSNDIVTLRYAANETPQAPPTSINAPTSLTASAVSGRVTVRWIDNSNNESAFSIERCIGKSCTAFVVYASVGANTATFADTGVSRNAAYRYRVRAASGSVASPYSNIATATTPKK